MNLPRLIAIAALGLCAAAPAFAVEVAGKELRRSSSSGVALPVAAAPSTGGRVAPPRTERISQRIVAQFDSGALYSNETAVQGREIIRRLETGATEKICSWKTNDYGNAFVESGFCALKEIPVDHSMCACATPHGLRLGIVITKPVGTGQAPAVR